jgi:DNA end-binding protein Ku
VFNSTIDHVQIYDNVKNELTEINMRAIWTGAISFGLVNIPVRLYSAINPQEGLDFDMLRRNDLCPIKYARVCRSTGEEIPYEDIVKGYEYRKGDYIVLSEEDFKKANAKKTKSIEIVSFAKESQIDTVYFEKPYFLEPDKNSEKPYALLREAIRESKKVGVAKFVVRNREHLGIIKPHGNVLILNQLRYEKELRSEEDLKLPKKDIVNKKEIQMALNLIDQLTEKFTPAKYHDTYIEDLKKIIAEKAHGHKPKQKGKEPKFTEAEDLMKALRASLQKEKVQT